MAVHDHADFPVLLLGPESCGKSLLLKSLQYYSQHGRAWDFGSIPRHGRPTVGVDLVNFVLPLVFGDAKKREAKRQNTLSITLRELGGQMAPLWPTYFDKERCRGLIYCIDSINPFQASRAAVELARILKNSKFAEVIKGLLIVFTKSADLDFDPVDGVTEMEITPDANSAMTVTELRSMMLLDDILDEAKLESIDIVTKCSAVNGTGLAEVFAWMERIGRT